MNGVAARTLVVMFALALVPASAGTGAAGARTPVALTAAPAHVMLTGRARTTVRVTNSGTRRVVVDVARAGFSLDLRGRPRIVRSSRGRSATRWLSLRPAHLTLGPRSSTSLVVAAKLPRHAEPGDHDALVLLRTRPVGRGRVAVRLRMGVVVVVRAPGKVVRRLELRRLHAARRGSTRALELLVANRGTVTESVAGARAVVTRARSGRRLATLVAHERDLRPQTRGIVEFRFGRPPSPGSITARITIPAAPGRAAVQRAYRVRIR